MVVDAVAPWAELVLFTADDLAGLPDDTWHYELVQGRLVRISPSGLRHGDIAVRLATGLHVYADQKDLGLVVEVASPSQHRPEMAAKARLWLEAGVRLIWVVWPAQRQIDVWAAGDSEAPRTLEADTELSGEDVLPDFRFPLTSLW